MLRPEISESSSLTESLIIPDTAQYKMSDLVSLSLLHNSTFLSLKNFLRSKRKA